MQCSSSGSDRAIHAEALKWLTCTCTSRLRATCRQLYELGNQGTRGLIDASCCSICCSAPKAHVRAVDASCNPTRLPCLVRSLDSQALPMTSHWGERVDAILGPTHLAAAVATVGMKPCQHISLEPDPLGFPSRARLAQGRLYPAEKEIQFAGGSRWSPRESLPALKGADPKAAKAGCHACGPLADPADTGAALLPEAFRADACTRRGGATVGNLYRAQICQL